MLNINLSTIVYGVQLVLNCFNMQTPQINKLSEALKTTWKSTARELCTKTFLLNNPCDILEQNDKSHWRI